MSGLASYPSLEASVELQNTALLEIVTYPARLTTAELVVRLEDAQGNVDRVEITDAIHELKRGGLVRLSGQVLEPTLPAIHATTILL